MHIGYTLAPQGLFKNWALKGPLRTYYLGTWGARDITNPGLGPTLKSDPETPELYLGSMLRGIVAAASSGCKAHSEVGREQEL